MKVHLLLPFLFVILNAFTLNVKHEEESMESSDQVAKYSEGSSQKDELMLPRLAKRIIRGQEAKKHAFPWLASFRINGVHVCGGSLIGDEYVLTAAHCFDFKEIGNRVGAKNDSEEYLLPLYEVVLGDHYVNTTEKCEEQKFGIANFVALKPVTNRSDVNLKNDVAVVRLNGKATMNRYVSVICLPSSSITISPGDKLTFAGWGISKHTYYDAKLKDVIFPEKYSNVLKVATTTVTERQNCGNFFNVFWHPAGEDIICTKEEDDEGVSSIADEGNPLMYQDPTSNGWVQVGIYSYRNGRKSENGYSNVTYFLKDIEEMKKELGYSKPSYWSGRKN